MQVVGSASVRLKAILRGDRANEKGICEHSYLIQNARQMWSGKLPRSKLFPLKEALQDSLHVAETSHVL